MSLSKPLKQKLHSAYQNLINRHIELRQNHTLEWVFETPAAYFLPDYLQLSRFGKTTVEARLNRLLSKINHKLWEKIVLNRINTALFRQMTSLFKSEFLHQFPEVDQHPKFNRYFSEYVHYLDSLIRKADRKLYDLTFTEIFYFLSECLHIFITHHQLEYPLLKEKQSHHALGAQTYKEIREEVLNHPDPKKLAALLSIRANWIDSAESDLNEALHGFREEINDILNQIQLHEYETIQHPFFQWDRLSHYLKKPSHILYEIDNCGELYFDLLLTELLLQEGHQVTLAAKGQEILNDATHKELETLLNTDPQLQHLHHYLSDNKLQLINTGSIVAGKVLHYVTPAYKTAYLSADLLILKGQGNFQTMPIGTIRNRQFIPYSYKKPIVYMMALKADMIQQAFARLFRSKIIPQKGQLILYVFDYKNPNTYPT